MYATTEMRLDLVAPGAAYFVLTAAGIVLALGSARSWPRTPLLRRVDGPLTVQAALARLAAR